MHFGITIRNRSKSSRFPKRYTLLCFCSTGQSKRHWQKNTKAYKQHLPGKTQQQQNKTRQKLVYFQNNGRKGSRAISRVRHGAIALVLGCVGSGRVSPSKKKRGRTLKILLMVIPVMQSKIWNIAVLYVCVWACHCVEFCGKKVGWEKPCPQREWEWEKPCPQRGWEASGMGGC